MNQQQLDKYILGAGKLYFDPEDANEALTGEIYLGDTPGFTLAVASEIVEDWSSDSKIAERHAVAATRLTRSSSVTVKNISMLNLGLFLVGDDASLSQTATPVVGETHTVQQGRYYQLGRSASNPGGVRNVSSVAVKGSGGTPTHVLDTDYSIDLAAGLIYIIPGGGIADDDVIEVDYTPAAETRNRVTTSDSGVKYGAIHFIADNTNGENRDLYIPRGILRPDGELAMKSRDTFMEMAFTMDIMKRPGWAQVIIDDRAVA